MNQTVGHGMSVSRDTCHFDFLGLHKHLSLMFSRTESEMCGLVVDFSFQTK